MLKNAIAYAEICGIYANFCICGIQGIIFAYAILKMPEVDFLSVVYNDHASI